MKKVLFPLLLASTCHTRVAAESFTTNIVDGFATNITTEFILGDTGPHNFLLITNGGAMTNLDRVWIGRSDQAHSNTAIVTGAGSAWHLREDSYLGLRSAWNTLAISDAALVGAGNLYIGSHPSASNNFLHVTGAGTRMNAAMVQLVGLGAGNELLAEDGAFLNFGSLFFNSEAGIERGQVATVRGAGTRLWTFGVLRVDGFRNRLSIADGAESVNSESIIGTGTSTANDVLVSGTGTRWKNTFAVSIGLGSASNRNNSVVIRDGALLQSAGLYVGQIGAGNSCTFESGARFIGSQTIVGEGGFSSRLLVTGAGTTFSNFTTLTVGQAGSDNLFALSNGAFAQTDDVGVGMNYTSLSNAVLASGTNTLWIADRLTVGSAGDFNSLSIENGANLFASSLLSGGQGGSGNSTHVYGPGALLSLTNALDLSGGNSLLVTNDARVESGSAVIGSFGPSNVAIISHGSWSNVNSLVVGSQATDNSLYAFNIARLYASNFVTGVADNADRNRVHISGKGTFLRLANALQLGSWGDTNRFFIGDGAAVSAGQLHVGGFVLAGGPSPASFPADANTLAIDGATTVVNVAGNISVGHNGSHNRFEASGGADLTSTSIEVGTRANSTDNKILITDPGTHWRNTNTLMLGSNGYRNSLVVSNGARLSTGPLTIGASGFRVPFSQSCTNQIGWNEVLVTGEGSTMEVAGRTPIMGRSLSNLLVVARGGNLRLEEINFDAGGCTPDYSNLVLVDRGLLVISNRLYLSRARFRMLGGRANISNIFVEVGPPGRFQVIGGTLRVGSIYASAPAEAEIGDGIHRATLELTSPNNFSSGRIIIARNSVLAGRGSIGGLTNAGTYGTLRAITAITNASLLGSSGFDVWIQGTGAGAGHSMLQLSAPFNPAIIEGRLRVALSPSFRPQPTDEFRILTHGNATGAFENAPHNSRINTVDNLASFRVFYTNSAVLLTDYRSTDLDGDSIEDAWATNYFGHTPLTSVERLSDSDGDGMSNYDEFRADTDPTNAASALRVTASSATGSVTLRWSCVDGKTYRIYSSKDLQAWSEIAEPTLAFPEPSICQWTHTEPDGGMRFYRVAVE